jgi:hypothetical protein
MRLHGFHHLLSTHAQMYSQPTFYDKVPAVTTVPKHTVTYTQQNKTKNATATKCVTCATTKATVPLQSDSNYESSEETPNVGTIELPVFEKKGTGKAWWV